MRRAPAAASIRRGYIAVAIVIAAVVAVNISSLLHDTAGRGLPAWKPVVWELTSGLVIIACAAIPLAALRRAPPESKPLWRVFAIHVAASFGFSATHVAGIIGLREIIYAALGQDYVFGLNASEFLYEYRKDAVVYGLTAAIFWVSDRLSRQTPTPPASTGSAGEPTIEIRDGARLIRAKPAEILCARAAGNYVEFRLVGGQTPLMRATLGDLERRLETAGFVRTHRSWLVNRAHIRESEPTGAGDFVLRMSDGNEAPLSRRFERAVAIIRGRDTDR